MKSVISAAVIFIFIVVTAIASNIYVNRTVDELLQFLYKNENYVAKNMWEDVENEIEKLEEKWEKKRPVMSAFLNHTILEQADMSITKVKNAAKMQKNSDFIYESDYIKLILLNIKEQQKISIENIF